MVTYTETDGAERRGRFDRRTFLRGTGATVAAGTLAGCPGGGGDSGLITIGALQPLSGPFTPWGQAHRAGLAFAVDEINEDGGVLDRDLEVVEADTGSDPGQADTIFRRHVEQDGAVAMAGPVSSDVGIRTRQTAEELEVPLVLHMAGSHRILPKDVRYCFRMGSHSAVTDMTSVTQLIDREGYETVGAIMADYEWGRSVETVIGELMPDGVDLTAEIAPLDEDDFTPFLREMPDETGMLIASGHPPGQISIHNQAIELGLEAEVTPGAGFPPAVLAGGLGENATTFAHQHVADPFSDQFVDVADRFREANGERFDTHEAYGYATGQMLASAIEEADSTEPTAIADALRSTTFDTLLANPIDYVEWGEMRNLVHMLSTFEFEAPEYYPDGEWRLVEAFRSEPLDAFDPDEWEF
jgi:branched-chain amino acid transport system substrate-binding protein